MRNPTRSAERDQEIEDIHQLGPAPAMPRWVKVFGLAFLLLLVAIGIMIVHGITSGQGPFEHQALIGH